MSANLTAIIEMQGVSKSFGRNSVLSNVSLSLEPGKFYALLGRNGAGKSTLMKILMRYEQPDQGQAWVFDRPLDADLGELNQEIGYVSEALDYALPLTIKQLFAHYATIYTKWDQGIFDDILARLRIDVSKHFKDLSRGQKMQVSFAAAVAIRPRLIVLDEITAVLDANARSFFMGYLGKYTREGGTVLMATNIVSEVQHFADHLILIDNGTIKFDQPLREVAKQFRKLRKKLDYEHEIFKDETCVEVGLNSDNSTSYLISTDRAANYKLSDDLSDHRGITAEEIFIYFTRGKAE